MKRILPLILMLVFALNVGAIAESMLGDSIQQSNFKNPPDMFIEYDERAMYPGGEALLMKYIKDNLQYPADAKAEGVEGRVVIQFKVEVDGSIGAVKVVRGRHPSLDKEAERIVKSLPNFIPAKSLKEGKPTQSWFVLPVIFKLPKREEQK
jgi:protein TonB